MRSYLNLGCGTTFHKDWTNVDFQSTGEGVIAHNLVEGVPFENDRFRVVYHSHVLEHFARHEAERFMAECYRVLKPGGVLRVVIPDLEQIARCYISQLEKALQGDKDAEKNYDWMMLEMYDQVARDREGGEMLEYLKRLDIDEDFVYKRIGDEGRKLRKMLLSAPDKAEHESVIMRSSRTARKRNLLEKLFRRRKRKKKHQRLTDDDIRCLQIGRFRKSGEIHQWMYDRFSLGRLLKMSGFRDSQIMTSESSLIPGWAAFNLDGVDGRVRKPDSLFMEAVK